MRAIHFGENPSNVYKLRGTTDAWESGYWVVGCETAERLIGGGGSQGPMLARLSGQSVEKSATCSAVRERARIAETCRPLLSAWTLIRP